MLLLFAILAIQKHPLAYFETSSKGNGLYTSVLYVKGERTDMSCDWGQGTSRPFVERHRMPDGDLCGDVSQTVDGAYLMSANTGLVYRDGKLQTFDGDLLSHKGNYALFLPTIDGMAPQDPGCAHGILYSKGKSWDIGFIRRAGLKSDGTVTG